MLKTPPRPKRQASKAAPAGELAGQPVPSSGTHVGRDFTLGLCGGLLLWAAFPPLDLPLLAWIAPIPWLWLCFREQALGRRSYTALWLAGTVHWLLMLEGIRLAHPALYAGWIALSAYLGVYLPVFIGLARVAVHRWRLPLILAAPVVWVGLELARGHLLTGFSMGLLAHTQAEFPHLIQIADLAGGYTLSFVIMLVAACLATGIERLGRGHDASREAGVAKGAWGARVLRSITQPAGGAIRPLAIAAAAVASSLAYGHWRLDQAPIAAEDRALRVALIQGSLDTIFDESPEQYAERVRDTFDHYHELTTRAVEQHANLDLVVWPESALTVAERRSAEPFASPADDSDEAARMRKQLAAAQADFQLMLAAEAERANANTDAAHPGTMLLAGGTTLVYSASDAKVYNSALLADRQGQIAGRYYKTHPVMFGEYIPFAEALPWLYTITPMSGGLSIGDGPKIFDVASLKLSPSICFESTIPHLIRRQLAELRRRGTPADVLVNVTNDGWFWGTGMLDLHFRCGVFRAVENRKPLLVAANTGISTHVAGSGIVEIRGPKRQAGVFVAQVYPDGRTSPYSLAGDWPAALCALVSLAAGVTGLRRRPTA